MRWGLIGIGRHADRFVAPAIRHSASGELVAVYSRDPERGKAFAERHTCPTAYDSLDAFLSDPRVDAVYVSSPNHVHKDQVIRAAQAGRHVLCEKPLALTVEDCRSMINACESAGVRLGVGFHLRHNPAHVAAKELVSEGALGEILFAQVQYMHVTRGVAAPGAAAWRRDPRIAGGGSFMGTGVHAVDLLRFVLGREIIHVSAVADRGWYDSGLERIIQVSVLMDRHLVASVSSGTMRYPMNDLVLYSSSVMLRCQGTIGNYGGGRLELVSDQGTDAKGFDRCDVYEREVDAFARSVSEGSEPNASGEDGLRVTQATVGIYDSLRNRLLVELDPLGKNAADD